MAYSVYTGEASTAWIVIAEISYIHRSMRCVCLIAARRFFYPISDHEIVNYEPYCSDSARAHWLFAGA